MIIVDARGENQIVVAPGRNAELHDPQARGAVLSQLEIPVDAVACRGRRSGTLLPQCGASTPDPRRSRAGRRGRDREPLRARGAARNAEDDGADARRGRRRAARGRLGGRPRRGPGVQAVDGTAAGDAFTACLVVSRLEGREWGRPCAGPAPPARSRPPGSERSPRYPRRARWVRCSAAHEHSDPARLRSRPRRRDRDPARAREPGGGAARGDDRRRQPDAPEDDRQRHPGAGAGRQRRRPGRDGVVAAACARAVRRRATSTARPGSTGRTLPPPQASPVDAHAVDFLAERLDGATLVATGPLTNVALLLARYPDARLAADRADGWRDRGRQRHAGGRVQRLGRPGSRRARLRQRTRRDDGRPRRDAPGAAHRLARRGPCAPRAGSARSWRSSSTSTASSTARCTASTARPFHDAVALAHAFRPGLLELERLNVRVDYESELCRGRTVVDVWRRTGLEPNASVACRSRPTRSSTSCSNGLRG